MIARMIRRAKWRAGFRLARGGVILDAHRDGPDWILCMWVLMRHGLTYDDLTHAMSHAKKIRCRHAE